MTWRRPLEALVGDFSELWQLVDHADRRRLIRSIAGGGFLACLEAVGVGLVLPLTLLLLDPEAAATGPLTSFGSAIGIESTDWLVGVLAASVLVLFIGRSVLGLLLLRQTLSVILRSEAQLARRLLVAYLHAPLEYHVAHNSAEMQRTLDDSLRRIFKDGLALAIPAAGDAVLIALVSVVVLVLAPLEALVGGAVIALTIVGFRKLARVRALALASKVLERQQDALQQIQQSLGAVREIQVAGAADAFADNLLVVRQERADHERRLMLTELLPRYLLELGMLVSAGAVGLVAFLTLPSDRAAAVVALFIGAVARMLPSVNRVLAASTRLSVAIPNVRAVERALTDLEGSASIANDSRPLPPSEQFRVLCLHEVSYRYPDSRSATLDNIHVDIEHGTYLGIVGQSGAGKTTLLNVMLGLIDPTAGRISVNGRPISECRRSWQRRIGYVPQDVAFLDASILQNIALGEATTKVDRAKVRQALGDALMLDVIDDLPCGIDTPARESGARLSGGQRQRLGLARALYRDPEILILDEATSALDSITEQGLLDTLDRLRGRVTIIVVAHRPSMMSRCDIVLNLMGGQVHE